MAAAVLRSQDPLRHRLHVQNLADPPPTLKPRRNPNPKPKPKPNSSPNPNPNSASRSLRQKRSPPRSRLTAKPRPKNIVMEQVTILKRGEKLGSPVPVSDDRKDRRKKPATTKEVNDLVLSTTERLGPEPEMVQKQVRVSECSLTESGYAGTGFFDSPPPSSLPFPAFFGKKEKTNDAATCDLRRLLRLDAL